MQISQSLHHSRPNTRMLDQPAGLLWSSLFEDFFFLKLMLIFCLGGFLLLSWLGSFTWLIDGIGRAGQRDLTVRGAGYEHSTASACGGAKWFSLHWRRRCKTRRNAGT